MALSHNICYLLTFQIAVCYIKQDHKREVTNGGHLSSHIWFSGTMRGASHILVVDANNPADILEIFPVTTSHILCLSSVPGKQYLFNLK